MNHPASHCGSLECAGREEYQPCACDCAWCELAKEQEVGWASKETKR